MRVHHERETDGVKFDHEKKSDEVRVDHEKKNDGVVLTQDSRLEKNDIVSLILEVHRRS